MPSIKPGAVQSLPQTMMHEHNRTKPTKILVTGANGLIGRELCSFLGQSGFEIIHAVRKSTAPWETSIGEVDEFTNWDCVLDSRVDAVVHLAAKTPQSAPYSKTHNAQYRRVNALGAANLARQCAAKGVKRFVFISTIKVLGEGSEQPYRFDDFAAPSDAYAISKWEAEQSLKQIAKDSEMEVVILRPPLVYGPKVKGNFLRLMQAVEFKRPLPLGAIHNRRSLIYLNNLVDAIKICLTHPNAANKTFLVSDGEDVSTPELIRRMAAALDCSALILPFPVSLMKWVGKLLGKQPSVERLVGSLTVDMEPLKNDLGWMPPYSMQSGLAATVDWYKKNGKSK